MTRSRFLAVGCALLMVTACGVDHDVTAPAGVPGDAAPLLQELVGIVELTDEDPAQLALRVPGDRLVLLLYGDAGAIMRALGKQVHVIGTFTESGSFAVYRFDGQEDGDVMYFRMREASKRSSPALRLRLW